MGLFDKFKNVAKNAGGGGGGDTQMHFGSGVPSAPLEQSMNRYRFQRGLNLGSWFTTEDWLATQLYSHAADPKRSDFDLARAKDAKALMEHHWDTWVTDDDWNWIKQRGFNSVRLPVSTDRRGGGIGVGGVDVSGSVWLARPCTGSGATDGLGVTAPGCGEGDAQRLVRIRQLSRSHAHTKLTPDRVLPPRWPVPRCTEGHRL